MSISNTGAENILSCFGLCKTLLYSPNTLCEIIRWLPHLTDVHLLLVCFPPVGDGEVPPAQQEGQGDHHQHEDQDGPEFSEILSILKMVLNNPRSERAILIKRKLYNTVSNLFNPVVLSLSICIISATTRYTDC